jgi:GNAT superfamily N-acetyltransferase
VEGSDRDDAHDSLWIPAPRYPVLHEQFGDAALTLFAEQLRIDATAWQTRFIAAHDAYRIAHLVISHVEKTTRQRTLTLPAGTVLDLFVHKPYRRRRIATRLWDLAVQHADPHTWPIPKHSPSRTRDGEHFVRSTNETAPPLHENRLVTADHSAYRTHLSLPPSDAFRGTPDDDGNPAGT